MVWNNRALLDSHELSLLYPRDPQPVGVVGPSLHIAVRLDPDFCDMLRGSVVQTHVSKPHLTN